MSTSVNERIPFVNTLDVHHDSAASDSATVNGNACVAYAGNLDRQTKEDIINSTLFAQLASDKRYPGRPMDRMMEWHESYKDVLTQIGWVAQGFNMMEVGDANQYGSVDKLVLHLGAEYLTGGELALFTTMIKALAQPQNDTAAKLFDNSTSSYDNSASFRVGVASNMASTPILKIGTYQYSSPEKITSALFFTFGSSRVSFFAGNQSMVFNKEVYAELRDPVLQKLGDAVWHLVKNVEI
ncbi:hypothetical protein GY45DRAFT_1375024 [Cubamyces sp. BRFM 1775]|nr:hypothetical protein GY45DRAFT_1375024 [Cubamyces sp. BRFM 1775]